MKIKHFAGYGCVNAKKISSRTFEVRGEKKTELKIEVWGNHERGLAPYMDYSAFEWLVLKHFGKQYNYNSLECLTKREWYEKLSNGVNEEHCEFSFLIIV